jgi:hypothetical protein
VLGLLAARGFAQQGQFVPATSPPAAAGTEVDITARYAITPQAGEWTICAHSYVGPNAPTLAVQLTEEIRNKHHMAAYIMNRGAAERRRMREEYEQACRKAAAERGIPLVRQRRFRIEEQCAVLIGGPGGGWSRVEDANAFLKKVRDWPLPELHLDNGIPAYDMKLIVRPIPGNTKEGKAVPDGEPINPFAGSFVIHNPTVPRQVPQNNKFDTFLTTLNAGEEYSLLKCPQPWTLAVKEYIGAAAITPSTGSSSFLDKLNFFGHKDGEGISAAGQQAHELARFLRQIGFQTYVLHTRTSSVVTVGAFRGRDDPEMERIQDRLAHFTFQTQNGEPSPITLMPRALPMEVPHP